MSAVKALMFLFTVGTGIYVLWKILTLTKPQLREAKLAENEADEDWGVPELKAWKRSVN